MDGCFSCFYRILQGLRIILNQKRGIERTVFPVADYSKSNVSEKVLRIIVSYTDYIKRNPIHKYLLIKKYKVVWSHEFSYIYKAKKK